MAIVTTSYNDKNQMVEAKNGDSTVTNTFNAEGLRAAKTVDDVTTYYCYEYSRVTKEVDSSGSVAYNVYGTNLISRELDGQKVYYIYNRHGDVTALLSSSGVVIGDYYYDAFGVIVEENGNFGNPYRYSGYMYDEESSLYNLNARYYDAKLARFMQEDTYLGNGADPLSLNLYAYCNNNPLIYYDPTGYAATPATVTLANGTKKTATVTNGITTMSDGSRPPVGSTVSVGGKNYYVIVDKKGSGGVSGVEIKSQGTASVTKTTSSGKTTTTKATVINGSTYVNGVRPSEGSIVTVNSNKRQYIVESDLKGGVMGRQILDYEQVSITTPGFDGNNSTVSGWSVLDAKTTQVMTFQYNGVKAVNLSVVQSKDTSYVITTTANVFVQKNNYSIGDTDYNKFITETAQSKSYEKAYWQMYHDIVAPSNQKAQLDDFTSSNAKTFNALVQQVVKGIGSDSITKDIHYARNAFNRSFATLDEMTQYNLNNKDSQWKLLDPSASAYHMSGDGGEYNVKFVSPDGMFEVVYDKNGNRVTSAINMGTYNFFGPSNAANHNDYDVKTYYIYGNTVNDRALGSGGAIKMAAENLLKYNSNSDAIRQYNQLFSRFNPEVTYPPEASYLYEDPNR